MLRLLAGLFSLLSLGAIAAVAGVGMVVWRYDRGLPDHDSLVRYEPATLSRVYSGEGALLAEFARERRVFVPIEEIPDLVKQAFISAEDKNFYTHAGIDPLGIARAAAANLQAIRSGSSRLQGASTITQQVMKNFLLTSDRSIERKIKEAILSVRIERAMSKDRILELYLNEIFLGQNAYGVAAAAARYFGKTLEDLTLAEAAYLAALPKAPSDLHPVRQRARAEGRRNYVLRQMSENGVIDAAAMRAAQAEPLATLFDGLEEAEVARPAAPTYFTEEVRRQVSTGALSAAVDEKALFEGGLTVRATIDPRLQEAAATALRRALQDFDEARGGYGGPVTRLETVDLTDEAAWRAAMAAERLPRDVPGWRPALVLDVANDAATLGIEGVDGTARITRDAIRDSRPRLGDDRLGPRARDAAEVWTPGDVILVEQVGEGWETRQIPEAQGAFMAMEIETGRVLAMQGGFSYDHSVFNRATQALRQPGSAFKPFVYAAALEHGYTPATIILDAPVTIDNGTEVWRPKNYSGRFYGPSPMRVGLELSRNLMTVRLANAIGMETVADYAERFGVYDDMPALLSYALGAGETTLYDIVSAYAMFANGGRRIEPTLVDRVQDRRGETVWRHDARICVGCNVGFDPSAPPPAPLATGAQAMDPVTAYQIVSMLRGVVTRGTATRAFANVSVPVAGKTGTTNEAKDVWFVGFTDEMAFGCYIGFDDPRPLGERATGGGLCAPAVAEFVNAAYADGAREAHDFTPPEDVVILDVDRWSGDAGGEGDVIAEAFRYDPDVVTPIGGGEVIGGDSFFTSGDLPMSLGEDAASGATAEAAPAQPGRPAPPRPRDLGRGGFGQAGGLY